MSKIVKKSEYPNDYFVLNRTFLTLGGLWPPKTTSLLRHRLYKFYQILVFVFCIIIYIPSFFINVIDKNKSTIDIIKNFNIGFTIILASIKFLFWRVQANHVAKVMENIESDEYHYENVENFNPGLEMFKAKRVGIYYGLVFLTLAHLTVYTAYFPVCILAFKYLYRGESIVNVTVFMKMPYDTYVPFEYHSTPERYLWAALYQYIPLGFYSFNLIGMDTLFMNMLNFVTTHLQILKGAFLTIRKRCLLKKTSPSDLTDDGLHNSPEMEYLMSLEAKKCFKHLQIILWICQTLEANYKYITLGQVLTTLYVLCTSLFFISLTPLFSKQFLHETMYLVGISFQLLLYCWFGNEVTLKASEIPSAIYESQWLEAGRSFKVGMLITMLRMSRSLHLTVGRFYPLTLDTYIAILKGSYTYYTVLRNTNS